MSKSSLGDKAILIILRLFDYQWHYPDDLALRKPQGHCRRECPLLAMALVSFTGLVLSLYQRLALGAPCITWVLLFWHVDSLARGPNQPRALTIFSKQLITFAITFATSPRSYLQGQDTGLQHFKPKPSCSPSGTQETHSVFTMWYFCSRPMAPDSHITVAITGKHWLVHHLGWKPGIRVASHCDQCVSGYIQ